MCVIIHRLPGVEIPFDKLRSACKVNADGMGIVVADRGKLELRKIFNDKGNDPEQLAKLIEDAADHQIYIHLRYKTKGAKDKLNVHPFTVLKQKKHGMDVQFMHNGTLSRFGNQADCDSKDFAETILNPLFQKLIPGVGEENLLSDPIVNDILAEYAGRGSIFLLADNFGNHTIVNKDNGYEHDGWWSSNEYSFNSFHREPAAPSKREWVQTEKKVISLPAVPKPAGNTGELPFNDEIPFDMGSAVGAKKVPYIPHRETFCEAAGVSRLSDVCQLSTRHIEDLVCEHPEKATLLIMDLLAELYDNETLECDA